MLSQNQRTQLTQRWKQNKPLAMSMTFVGDLICNESEESVREKLQQANFKHIHHQAKQRLQEESGEPSELPPSVATSAEDFVEVTYRALSATLLADRPIDFSNEKMLKRSVRLLKGQTVFKDHNTSVDNWVGRIMNAFWDEETKGIPPGINALLKLDAVKDPMTVRGVVQGVIHSASVTVSFEWKPSHPKLMDDGTFFERLGDEVDGELVRIIVSKIERFLEISLVWQGADEFAKQIGDDKRPVQQSAEPSPSCEIGQLSLQHSQSISKEDNMDPLKKILKETFGVEVTSDNIEQLLEAYAEEQKAEVTKNADAQITKLVDQLNTATASVTELEAKVKELEPQAALGKTYLEDERKEAIRLCKLVKGEDINQAIIKTLESGSLELVQAWKGEFEKEAQTKFPNKCAKCGSTEIHRQSSQSKTDSDDGEKKPSVVSQKTSEYVRDLHGL